ncbi:glutathione S-transferase family protein [Paucibacter sp. KCTC 42545]|uniref:glutathione S-transferase family protein n=1 Tax=Paucibacter sp. KCTC 42545 TaxID=1768242 RepID=UPI000733BF15|nr:glutathione S-transferase family protein [Paucibacter sp. KCTC 42545]ALT79167.1 glutathione S-transferase [Paucibacter sp. KCTC 42545]
MLQLHYHPSDASLIPHILLEELGVPFELKLVDRANNAQKSAAYLKLNPNGLIPVLVDGDVVLYETAAILLHLADRYPEAGLAPALATAQRAEYYKWMLWLSNTFQADFKTYYYAQRYVAPGNTTGAAEVKAMAEERLTGVLTQLDTQMHKSGGPWLLGAQYSALDCLAFVLCCWARNFKRPARDASAYPHLAPYLCRMLARPAVQRAFATEQLPASFFGTD